MIFTVMVATASGWLSCLVLFLAMLPVAAWAQKGRQFDTVEACVGTARVVHVGKIVEIKPIEFGESLTDKGSYSQ
jgi:hypothetical protein